MDISSLERAVQGSFSCGLAKSSQSSYSTAQKRYLAFCNYLQLPPLPLSERTLCSILGQSGPTVALNHCLSVCSQTSANSCRPPSPSHEYMALATLCHKGDQKVPGSFKQSSPPYHLICHETTEGILVRSSGSQASVQQQAVLGSSLLSLLLLLQAG